MTKWRQSAKSSTTKTRTDDRLLMTFSCVEGIDRALHRLGCGIALSEKGSHAGWRMSLLASSFETARKQFRNGEELKSRLELEPKFISHARKGVQETGEEVCRDALRGRDRVAT